MSYTSILRNDIIDLFKIDFLFFKQSDCHRSVRRGKIFHSTGKGSELAFASTVPFISVWKLLHLNFMDIMHFFRMTDDDDLAPGVWSQYLVYSQA